eukprot:contig_26082_g6419
MEDGRPASVGVTSSAIPPAGVPVASDDAAHYFPLLRKQSSVCLLPDSASPSPPLTGAGFKVTSPAIDGDGNSETFYAASREEAQQWVDAIEPWLLSWRDVAAVAKTCIPAHGVGSVPCSRVSETEVHGAMVACTAAAAAVQVAGAFVKAFGHGMANHAEIVRVGEAIPVAGPAFAVLAAISRQMLRYRKERAAVAGVVKMITRLTTLASTALEAMVNSSPGSVVDFTEEVLMELELATEHVQIFLHSKERRFRVLLHGTSGPSAIATRLDQLQWALTAIVGVDNRLVQSSMTASKVAGTMAPWMRPWPLVSAASHTDAKLYKNEAVVRALTEVFERKDKDDKSFLVAVLSGPAGVGKSEAAKCYIREQEGRYMGGVVVINAEDPTLARESLRFMSGLPVDVVDSVLLKNYVSYSSKEHGRMLLVLDNADELGGENHWLSEWLPHQCPTVDVLMTTRLSNADAGLLAFRQTLGAVCKVVPVHELSPDAAATALRCFIGKDKFCSLTAGDQECERLAVDFLAGPRGMGGLLLALSLAGRTIATGNGMTAVQYKELFERQSMELLDQEADVSVPRDAPRKSVQASVGLSLSALHEQSPNALMVLLLLCVFPSDGIPPNVHEVAVDVLSKLPPDQMDTLRFSSSVLFAKTVTQLLLQS